MMALVSHIFCIKKSSLCYVSAVYICHYHHHFIHIAAWEGNLKNGFRCFKFSACMKRWNVNTETLLFYMHNLYLISISISHVVVTKCKQNFLLCLTQTIWIDWENVFGKSYKAHFRNCHPLSIFFFAPHRFCCWFYSKYIKLFYLKIWKKKFQKYLS